MAHYETATQIPHARVQAVRLSFASDEDVRRNSVVAVESHDLFQNGLPVPGGAYDAALGSTDYSYRCVTCDHDKNRCLGHPGKNEMAVPVSLPWGIPDTRRWLRLLCTAGLGVIDAPTAPGERPDAPAPVVCGSLLVDPAKYAHVPPARRLEEAAKQSRKGKPCRACGRLQPEIRKDEDDYMTYSAIDGEGVARKLLPTILEPLFARVPDADVLALGRPLSSAPRNLLLRALPVAPTTIRPSVRRIGGGPSSYQDLTTLVQRIVRTSKLMEKSAAEGETPDIADILSLGQFVYEYMRGSGGSTSRRSLHIGTRAVHGIGTRWPKKTGRLRKNLGGKRAGHNCRSTIAGDSQLPVNVICLPRYFAQLITIEEPVTEFNLPRLTGIFLNGRLRYPGCTHVWKKRTGRLHAVERLPADATLETGDKLYRNIVDGDSILFNRQPTLKGESIREVKIRVNSDPRDLTIKMNVILTPWFNADFDGDQMNAPIPRSEAARAEAGIVLRVAANFVSPQTSAPITGQVQDSVIGSFELTRDGVEVARAQAMSLFAGAAGFVPAFPAARGGKPGLWTGRELVSLILAKTPITYRRSPKWYNEIYAPYLEYHPDEIAVEVIDGEVRRGVLDSKAVGDSTGSIFHRIAGKYGSDRALETLFEYQQTVIAFLNRRGFSIGVADFVVSEAARVRMRAVLGRVLAEAAHHGAEFDRGDAIPPIGQTPQEFYEETMIGILQMPDDMTMELLGAIDPDQNSLFRLGGAGSKGKFSNQVHISAAIGLITINGQRVNQEFAYHRASPYAPRYPSEPRDLGFIESNYLDGLSAREFNFGAMNGRYDLINKALSTSVTGDLNRRNVKALEPAVTDNLYGTMYFDGAMIQQLYGDDGLDPAELVQVKFPQPQAATGTKATAKAADTKATGTKAAGTKAGTGVAVAYEARRLADWDAFVAAGTRLESLSRTRPFTGTLQAPAGAAIALEDLLVATRDTKSVGGLDDKIALIEEWIARLPFAFSNPNREDRYIADLRAAGWTPGDGAPALGPQSPPVAAYSVAVRATARFVRATLDVDVLSRVSQAALEATLTRARRGVEAAVVPPGTCVGLLAAQYYSERQTQYMLDSHKRTAGTTKAGVERVKEIIYARPLERETDPRMLVRLAPEIESDPGRAREIANSLEVLNLRAFAADRWQIFYERFGAPAHPDYLHEEAMISEFATYRPALRPPADLSWFCIRFELDRTTLVFKSMSLETAVRALTLAHPDVFFVHSPENAPSGTQRAAGGVVLRAYLTNRALGSTKGGEKRAHEIKDALLNTILRGVIGVQNTQVEGLRRWGAAGEKIFAIDALGSNLADVLVHAGVDETRTVSRSVFDTYRQFGIRAARRRIIEELTAALGDSAPDPRWIAVYADTMTFSGEPVSLDYAAGAKRAPEHLFLRMISSTPLSHLESEAARGIRVPIRGDQNPAGGSMSEALMIGSVPRVGTAYNTIAVDPVLAGRFQSVKSLLDDL